jgi:hypothetical protein
MFMYEIYVKVVLHKSRFWRKFQNLYSHKRKLFTENKQEVLLLNVNMNQIVK